MPSSDDTSVSHIFDNSLLQASDTAHFNRVCKG